MKRDYEKDEINEIKELLIFLFISLFRLFRNPTSFQNQFLDSLPRLTYS